LENKKQPTELAKRLGVRQPSAALGMRAVINEFVRNEKIEPTTTIER
jgi:hypothetical protein